MRLPLRLGVARFAIGFFARASNARFASTGPTGAPGGNRLRDARFRHSGKGHWAVISAVAIAVVLAAPAWAEIAPKALKWADLIPASAHSKVGGLKSFLANRPNSSSPDHTSVPEGRWLSPGVQPQQQPSNAAPAPVVEELDGQRVKLGGYVVPLDFDATKVKEFLLVPFVGACIHVPPPPANQIVYVKSEAGFEVKGSFDPVWVTGKLKATQTFTGLAETGYSLDAENVEARAE